MPLLPPPHPTRLELGHPTSPHAAVDITCWNEQETEGRIVWGRNNPEEIGVDSWVRWVYTFTAFNEPLDLPADLPD